MGLKIRTIDRKPPDLDKIVAALASLAKRLLEEEEAKKRGRKPVRKDK